MCPPETLHRLAGLRFYIDAFECHSWGNYGRNNLDALGRENVRQKSKSLFISNMDLVEGYICVIFLSSCNTALLTKIT